MRLACLTGPDRGAMRRKEKEHVTFFSDSTEASHHNGRFRGEGEIALLSLRHFALYASLGQAMM